MKCYLIALLSFCSISSMAQINYTANDTVPPYTNNILFGANMGYYPLWDDEQLADIAAGNPEYDIEGVGVKTLRPTLPEHFLEEYGYEYRLPTFQHYQDIGIQDNTLFIGFPSEEHQDPTHYCTDHQSELFANMYTPIWDGGANGTPINDTNFYALYLYKMVPIYKDFVKFYEIWNEPDFDYSSTAWKDPGQDGNWWENDPDPCDYKLRAPVEHYVRLLRISYEVIKSLDSTAYIAVGGLGYPSFLDAVMRKTDNPLDGSPNADYPLYGGAYFDCLSFHSYPHADGSLREWNNDIDDFEYFRHSDMAVAGYLTKKEEMETVLWDYSYDGDSLPEKIFINTECNLPRKAFDNDIGSEISQLNFLIKALVASMKNDIRQFHVFNLAERESYDNASNGFKTMGLYEQLKTVDPYEQTRLDAGLAYKTTSDLMCDLLFDEDQTTLMQLPDEIDGGAFYDPYKGHHTYVLWAKTHTDLSEDVSATYSFPTEMGMIDLERKYWDHADTEFADTIDHKNIPLTATPLFLRDYENNALPVELLYFNGNKLNNDVLLDWVTVTEIENDYFEIEYSDTGEDFQSIGKVAGGGNTSSARMYQFIHKEAIAGNNYYRLKQFDFDGTYSYSPIINVPLTIRDLFLVSPTLTNSQVRVEFYDYYEKAITLEVFDTYGRTHLYQTIPPGETAIDVDMSDWSAGYYMFKLKVKGEGYFAQKVLKVRM